MATTVDAQRLIAMSLGKIHASRGQRGGINLHKNLLVAGVLQKARTIYMVDHYSMVAQDKKVDEDDVEEDEEVEDCIEPEGDQEVPSVLSSVGSLPDNTHHEDDDDDDDHLADDEAEEESDKENSPPSDANMDSKTEESSLSESPKETLAESQSENSTITGCQRCGKRRLTEVEAAVESIAPSPTKKSRHSDSENQDYIPLKSSSDSSTLSSHDNSTNTGPPNTKEQAMQISNLVHSFSAGFTGLLNGVQAATSVDSTQLCVSDCTNSTQSSGPKDITGSEGHTSASDSLHSCSTQIKEAFETLARPIIAMTV